MDAERGVDGLLGGMTDEDLRRTLLRAIRLVAVLALAGVAVAWWKGGWRSGLLLAIGAAISGTGLWEWMRLMSAVAQRMDGGGQARALGPVLVGFFLRLGLSLAVLYGSLRYLDGSAIALAVGLGLGVFALTVEGLRLARAWTM